MNIGKMLKEAQKLQQKMADAQKGFSSREFEVSAGGGAVSIVITGDFQIKKLALSPEVIDPQDREGLEDLIVTAVNQAVASVKESLEKEMGSLTKGMGLPPGLF